LRKKCRHTFRFYPHRSLCGVCANHSAMFSTIDRPNVQKLKHWIYLHCALLWNGDAGLPMSDCLSSGSEL